MLIINSVLHSLPPWFLGGSRIVMCTRIILTNRFLIKYYDTVWIAFCTKLFKMPTFYSLVVCWLWCWCRWSLVESLKLISQDLEAEAWQLAMLIIKEFFFVLFRDCSSQTWDLSKILHRQIFKPKILHL